MGVHKNEDGPRVAVIGGGVAGLSAAIHLAEAGMPVELFEKSDLLGGKLKGWDTLSPGGESGVTNPVEHGMHGWWTHYRNFRGFIERARARGACGECPKFVPVTRIGWVDARRLNGRGRGRWVIDKEMLDAVFALSTLRGFLDLLNPLRLPFYLRILRAGRGILGVTGMIQIALLGFALRFAWLGRLLTWIYPGYRLLFAFVSPDPPAELDDYTVREFTDSVPLGERVVRCLDVFLGMGTYGRPTTQSAYHLARLLDFYALRTPDAIWFDMCPDSAHADGVYPLAKHAAKEGVNIHTHSPVTRLERSGNQWVVQTADGTSKPFDYVVMALDISGAQRLLSGCDSPELDELKNSVLRQELNEVTVVRIWFRKRINRTSDPPCALAVSFAEQAGCPFDFVFIPSLFQKRLEKPSPYEVIEFHISYSERFRNLSKRNLVDNILEWALRLFPELKHPDGLLHTAISEVRNYSSVPAGHLKYTPTFDEAPRGLFLCGDWIRWTESPVMYMEKAFVTGMAAAQGILGPKGPKKSAILQLPKPMGLQLMAKWLTK